MGKHGAGSVDAPPEVVADVRHGNAIQPWQRSATLRKHVRRSRGGSGLVGRYSRVGMIARWRPVHRGHASVLRGLCRGAQSVLIGIGSSNRYDLRNPFTAAEVADMIRLVLPSSGGYQIDEISDFDDGPRWRAMVVERWGALDAFYSDNPYVRHLLSGDYHVARPVDLVSPAERVAIDGTGVRLAMAQGDGWRDLVPPEVARYLDSHGLVERFRREFGLATLAQMGGGEHVLVGRGHQ